MKREKVMENKKTPFTEEDLNAVWNHHKSYLIDILNGEYDLEDARGDLRGLIGSEFDPRAKNIDQENL